LAVLVAGVEVRAEPPAPVSGNAASSATDLSDEPKTLPQDGLFSSIKQSLGQGDREVIRGHFDLGTPPNAHRYYCLVDPKSHRREPNGVLGDPVPRPDGMTGIKSSAISLYRCEKAEQQGLLVTAGYAVPARSGAGTAAATAGQTAAPAQVQAPTSPAVTAPAAPAGAAPSGTAAASQPAAAAAAAAVSSRFPSGLVDVSGIKLGMSPAEVSAALDSKGLKHQEWSETLSFRDAGSGRTHALADGRFVSVIGASRDTGYAKAGSAEMDGEAFEVMFTPIPGQERAMAIVHSVGYSPTNAIRETALEAGLVEKYGGYAPGALPPSPTWLYRSGGTVTVGDDCGRRGVFGGLGPLHVAGPRENLSLEKSHDEFRFELERCGIAIVTEDHRTSNGGALREDRLITRYTVTAYSPTLAAEGADRAEERIRAAGPAGRPTSTPPRDSRVPDL
jgi:hypothetical protein